MAATFAPHVRIETHAVNEDPRDAVRHRPMSRFQMIAIAICIALTMLDGFDVLVISFTASAITSEWALSGRQLGMMLSAAPLGMTVGSFLLAPWADRVGRGAIVLGSLVLCSVGMLLSAFARTHVELAVMRLVTGIGIGGMLANVSVMAAEYSSDRWRNTVMSLQATGYPLCATIAGAIAALLTAHYGWRSVFLFGAFASASMIPLVRMYIPESLDFLLDKRPPNALRRINALLRRMNCPEMAEMPALPALRDGAPDAKPGSIALRRLFTGAEASASWRLALAFFLQMFSHTFVLYWTPKLLVAAGLTKEQGMTCAVLLSVGSIAGGATFGLISTRLGLQRFTMIAMLLAAGALLLFGSLAGDARMAFPIALVIGAVSFAAVVGLYALTVMLYPASIRATGMGWASGIGRIGGILAPIIAGFLFDGGWAGLTLYHAYALPLIAAALVVRSIHAPHSRGESRNFMPS